MTIEEGADLEHSTRFAHVDERCERGRAVPTNAPMMRVPKEIIQRQLWRLDGDGGAAAS